MNWIDYDGQSYPEYQAEGNAAQFILPFAMRFCVGLGYDIGCNREEWALPGAVPIDEAFGDQWHANHLPPGRVDYIFSSHCLEHINDWPGTLLYWNAKIRPGGVLFLYLPHFDQRYWRPWNNRKHLQVMDAGVIATLLESTGDYSHIMTTGRDLNHSFAVVGSRYE